MLYNKHDIVSFSNPKDSSRSFLKSQDKHAEQKEHDEEGYQVIDTDYDNYLIFFRCVNEHPEDIHDEEGGIIDHKE